MGFAKSLPRAIKLMANFRVTIFSCCQLASPQHATTRDFTPGLGVVCEAEDQKSAQKRRHSCHRDPLSCRGQGVAGPMPGPVFIAENIWREKKRKSQCCFSFGRQWLLHLPRTAQEFLGLPSPCCPHQQHVFSVCKESNGSAWALGVGEITHLRLVPNLFFFFLLQASCVPVKADLTKESRNKAPLILSFSG